MPTSGRPSARRPCASGRGCRTRSVEQSSSDSQLQQNCESQETPCLTARVRATASCSAIPASCTATVAQYSACIADQAAAFNKAVNGLAGCATVTMPDLAGVWAYMTADMPASCTAVTEQVPDGGPADAADGADQLGRRWKRRHRRFEWVRRRCWGTRIRWFRWRLRRKNWGRRWLGSGSRVVAVEARLRVDSAAVTAGPLRQVARVVLPPAVFPAT